MLKLLTRVNTGTTSCPLDIPKVESKYGASYVGEFCLRSSQDKSLWINSAASVFYCANPDVEKGHSHYFAIFFYKGHAMITNAESAVAEPIHAVVAKNGEIIYSRYRHDFRMSSDGSVFIDGGREYIRSSGSLIQIVVKDGQFFQVIETEGTGNDRDLDENDTTVQVTKESKT